MIDNYRIVREKIENSPNDNMGSFGSYILYKVFNEDQKIGEFYFKNVLSYFLTSESDYIIKANNFLNVKFYLIDKKSNQSIGEYKTSFFRKLFFKESGSLLLKNNRFVLKINSFSISAKGIFTSESKVSKSFTLKGDTETIEYFTSYNAFSDSERQLSEPSSNYCSFEIMSKKENQLLLFASIFLLEKGFS